MIEETTESWQRSERRSSEGELFAADFPHELHRMWDGKTVRGFGPINDVTSLVSITC